MIIEQIDSSKVLISLCNNDMEDYHLEFGTMDFENPHSKKILMRLLGIVCNKTGLSTKNKQLLLETLPLDSGCLILVTFMDTKPKINKYRIKNQHNSLCFTFEDSDNFINAVTLLYNENIYFRNCKAFLLEKKYYLIFDHCPVPHKAKRILSEFGKRKPCSRMFLSALQEAGKMLCKSNAVDVIGKCFCKTKT